MPPLCRYGPDCNNLVNGDGNCRWFHPPGEINCARRNFLERAQESVRLREQNKVLLTEILKIRNSRPKPVVSQDSREKTVLCDKYEQTGECPYGDNCTFAHGKNELRPKQSVPPCKFDQAHPGSCRFGDQCKFSHRQPPVAGYRPCEASLEKKLDELTL